MDLQRPLIDAIAAAAAQVRIGYPWWLRPWLAPSVIAITLGRRIYLRSDVPRLTPESLARLLRHELAHVRQVERLGLIPFLARYSFEFLRNLWRLRAFGAAYAAISFEVEAHAAEEEGSEVA
jgi:hypothetical protein